MTIHDIRPASATSEHQFARVEHATRQATTWLARYSIDILRINLGLVFLVFGALKFFPGISPAEDISTRVIETLTLNIVPHWAALLITAIVETFIGLTLISGKFVRAGLLMLGIAMIGIMSPLVLFFTDLVPGAPTLAAQYVFKDIVLVAAGMVIAAKTLGARLVTNGARSQ